MDSTKLKNAIKKFEEYLIVDQGLARRTAQGYGRSLSISLRRMRKYCPKYAEIKVHILWMHDKKYSFAHISNTILAIEHYTKYKGEGVKLGRPKKPKRIIKDFLSESEVSRMIAMATDIRRKSILSMLAYSGIRNQELCNLKLEDVDLGSNEIRVIGGKNIKDRIVNISCECTRSLIHYLKDFPRKNDEFLFTTLKSKNQLTTSDVRKMVKVLAHKTKLEKRVYPHLFRHSLASNLLKRGAGIMLIKEQLGHVYIDSTMVYVQSINLRTKSEYDYFKPAYM